MKDAELNIKVRNGFVTFTEDNQIEFTDTNIFSIPELEYIIEEAKAFQEYRNSQVVKKEHKKPFIAEWSFNFDDPPIKQKSTKTITPIQQHRILLKQPPIITWKTNYILKLKKHRYQFDVPLKPELIWIEFKYIREIYSLKCSKCWYLIQMYDDNIINISFPGLMVCPNCMGVNSFQWG